MLPLAWGSLLHASVCDPFLSSLQFLASVCGHTSYLLCRQVFATLLYEGCIWSPCWIMMISKFLITSAKSLMPVVSNLFGLRDQFHGRQFFHGPRERGHGFEMIQAPYIYYVLYFYYYHISSIIIYYFISIFILYN